MSILLSSDPSNYLLSVPYNLVLMNHDILIFLNKYGMNQFSKVVNKRLFVSRWICLLDVIIEELELFNHDDHLLLDIQFMNVNAFNAHVSRIFSLLFDNFFFHFLCDIKVLSIFYHFSRLIFKFHIDFDFYLMRSHEYSLFIFTFLFLYHFY